MLKNAKIYLSLFAVIAGAGSAQEIDTRLKLDQIKAGSYVVYALRFSGYPAYMRYESHVYAGRKGDQ